MAKFVHYNDVSLKSRFFFTYFTITGVKKIVRYPAVFVIDEVHLVSRLHCKATEIRSLFTRDIDRAHILALRNSINR